MLGADQADGEGGCRCSMFQLPACRVCRVSHHSTVVALSHCRTVAPQKLEIDIAPSDDSIPFRSCQLLDASLHAARPALRHSCTRPLRMSAAESGSAHQPSHTSHTSWMVLRALQDVTSATRRPPSASRPGDLAMAAAGFRIRDLGFRTHTAMWQRAVRLAALRADS